MSQGSTVVPTLLYRDAPAMIDWLCDVIGFAKKAVYTDDDGKVAHAELTLGPGMLMIGTVQPRSDALPFTKWVRPPDELDNIETQTASLTVPDPDAVYARVKACGGKVVLDIEDKNYGGRGFGFRDPEGHLWFVGSYDPWST